MLEILLEAKGNGECSYHVEWIDTIVLRNISPYLRRMATKETATDLRVMMSMLASQTGNTKLLPAENSDMNQMKQ